MIKRIIKILFVSLLAVVFIGSLAIAQGKGKGQSGDRPAGWGEGQKEGWQSEVPSGQEEKEKKRKNLSGEEEDLEDKQIEKEKKEKQEKKQHRKRKQNKKRNRKNN